MIVGRDSEFDAALGLLDRIDDGPSALFVEGEPGIGKTTLFDAAVAVAIDRGFRVLRCRPSQSQVRLPHAGLIEILDGVDAALVDDLPTPQRRAMRVALRWDDPGEIPTEAQTVSAAFGSVLRRKAQVQPILVAVDDLHWLDDASAHALEYAVRRLDGLRAAILAASRTAEGDRPRPMERAVRPDRVRKLQLGPLSDTVIRHLLSDRLGLDVAPQVARRIAQDAKGNPFVALEIGRAVQSQGAPAAGARLPIPEDVRAMVVQRLDTLSASPRVALLVAAASGLATSPPLDAVALAPAERAGIVRIEPDGAVRFVHPLYQSAVYEAAPAAERRRIHANLAATSDELEACARHLSLAADGPEGRVAAAIGEAAEAAARRGALDVAAELAERAWRLTPPEQAEQGASQAIAAAEGYLRLGRLQELARLVEEILPSLSGTPRARALRALGESRIWANALPEAAPIFEQALACVPADAPAEAAGIHMGLAFAHFQSGVNLGAVMQHATLALHEAERAGPGGPLGEALSVHAMVSWLLGMGVDDAALDLAVEVFDEHRFAPVQQRPKANRATVIGYTGRIVEAIECFQEEVQRCRIFGTIGDLAYLGLHLATLASWHGDHALMRQTTDETARICEELGGGFAQVCGCQMRVTAAAYEGRVDEARALGSEGLALAVAGGIGFTVIWIASALGKLELALGDHETALTWLEPGLANIITDHLPDPATLFYLPDAIEALILRGDLDRASALLDPYEHKSIAMGRNWTRAVSRRCRALLLAAQGQVDAAAVEASAAIDGLRDEGLPLELGRAYLVLGQVERRRRKRAVARTAFEEALRIFDRAGATLWEARAREQLGTAWSPRKDEGLTPSEQRVAQLAAEGMTNPEIAAQLFISRRTVEATLTRIYRKLGVRSRTELARAFTAEGPATP